MSLETLIVLFVALAAGLLAGWLMRARIAAPFESEHRALAERLATVEEMRNAALRDLVALKAEMDVRAEGFEAQINTLKEAREQLSLQFADTAGRMLAEAQKALAERNDQRFAQAAEKSETSLKALLQPVEMTLKRYEEGLGKVEKERIDSYAALREQIELVRAGQGQVRDETQRLVHALRSSPKARGRWGEQSLYNLLEQAGLSQHVDYMREVSVDTEDGRLRPDVIVRLPGGRELIIDAKCSLNAYQDASDAPDDNSRIAHLRQHAQSLRLHAQQLGAKEYWTRFGKAADYVVMFIPGEHFLSAALEQDAGLWEWAFERRVLLATPTNLIAITRTVASVWRQEKLAQEAQQVGALGKEMYERLSVAAGHLSALGRTLNNSVSHYNKFVSSFENRVLVTGRRFKELSVETGSREIDMIEPVEALARLPDAMAETDDPAAEAAE